MKRRLLTIAGSVVLVLLLGVVFGIRLVPVQTLMDPALQRIEEQNGWKITIADGRLAWSGFGLALRAESPVAVSTDGLQEFTADHFDVKLALGPLLKKRVEARAWAIGGGRFRSVSPRGTLYVDGLRLGGDLVFETDSQTTRVSGAGDFAGGGFLAADRDLPFPGADIASWIRVVALDDDRTAILIDSLRVGRGLVLGRGQGRFEPDAETYEFTGSFDRVALGELVSLLPDEERTQAEAYALGGFLTLPRFEARPEGARWEIVLDGVQAVLPQQGRRVTQGEATLEAPGNGDVNYRASFSLDGEPTEIDGVLREAKGLDLDLRLSTSGRAINAVMNDGETRIEKGTVAADLHLVSDVPPAPGVAPEATGIIQLRDLAGRKGDTEFARVSGDVVLQGDRMELRDAGAVVSGVEMTLTGSAVRNGEAVDGVVTAQLLRGELESIFRAVPGDDGWDYELDLAGDVSPGDLLRRFWPNAPEIEGVADIDLQATGFAVRAGAPRDLRVDAELTLLRGALRNVPALEKLGQDLGIPGVATDRWPVRDGFLRLQYLDGGVVVDTVRVSQEGAAWSLSGRIAPTGNLDLGGTLRLDPAVIRIPPLLAPVADWVREADGLIPVDFRLTGPAAKPQAFLDWEAVMKRAGERALDDRRKRIEEGLEGALEDEDLLNSIRKKLGGG